jgi:hypothetical protein
MEHYHEIARRHGLSLRRAAAIMRSVDVAVRKAHGVMKTDIRFDTFSCVYRPTGASMYTPEIEAAAQRNGVPVWNANPHIDGDDLFTLLETAFEREFRCRCTTAQPEVAA